MATTKTNDSPSYSSSFPAKRLTTSYEWGDLVLPRQTLLDVEEIKAWIEHRETLLHQWGLGQKIPAGFRSLFYGPSGTGKTLAATLIGKSTGRAVYRVDLALAASKWIGETEKNLASVLDRAEKNDWILFFDEADALFGKRTQVMDAHDRYADQEVSYLLQHVEDFPGVVILAGHLKGIDQAFARRFQSVVYFPVPGVDERLRLWQGAFEDGPELNDDVSLKDLAEKYEITGGGILNVLRYASLMTLRRDEKTVRRADIEDGVRRELRKDGN
jgi:SpoVK/Ycf46/Vps4 family AAA+-type ATPase